MNTEAKKIAALILVLLLAGASALYGSHVMKQVRKDTFYREKIGRIYELSGVEKIDGFHKKIDTLRVFINKNSQHLEDEEFRANWRDQDKLATAFLDYLEGRRKDLPHMECSTRRGLMAEILNRRMNIQTRSIDLYNPSAGGLGSHAAMDVWNPEAKRWETIDPEYDVYWRAGKGQRVTMLEAALDKNAVPCNAKTCGWTIKSDQGARGTALKAMMAYIVIIDKAHDVRMTYHSPDLDPGAVYAREGRTGTYCELLAKNCRDGFIPRTFETIKKSEYVP